VLLALYVIFTAPCYGLRGLLYAAARFLSVCPSVYLLHSGIVSKWLDISFQFSDRVNLITGSLSEGGVVIWAYSSLWGS